MIFRQLPDQTEIFGFSAPGRSEIGGNHTDHQWGRVLAAAVNLRYDCHCFKK
jgi:galactokinase